MLADALGGSDGLALGPLVERLYEFVFSACDELGNAADKRLVAELLGRGPNLILVDGEGRIIDCLHRTEAGPTEKRRLLPGLFYEYPPKPGKPSIFEVSETEFKALFEAAPSGAEAESRLVSAFAGVSPLLARELVYRATGSADTAAGLTDAGRLYREFLSLAGSAFVPVLLRDGPRPFDVYCLPVGQYGGALETLRYASFSELFDDFYTERERLERLAQRSRTLMKTVASRRDRAARKLVLRTQELKAAENREELRRRADLIKANIYRMSRGQTLLIAEDFYSEEGGLAEIPLEARLSPQQNAEKYYRAYNKAKNAERILRGQIEEARTELEYLDSVLEELERAGGERELEEIRRELAEEGYIREAGGSKSGRKKPAASQPLRFVSSAGAEILVGRNNVQNERLTLRFAGKNDIWLHAQKTPGSHVIAFCGEDDRVTLTEAALLAAYYSKARRGSNVPVDYTKVRHVKKRPGGKTGMVVYTDYRTLFVTPDEETVKRLLAPA